MNAALLALTVTVIIPEAAGPGAADAAAALGDVVARALSGHQTYRRVGETSLLPGELVTAFACDRLDSDCAARAGAAAGTDLALVGHVVRLEAGVEVELELVDVRTRLPSRRVLRFVRTEGEVEGGALRPVLEALVGELLDGVPAETSVPELVVSSTPRAPPVERGVQRILGWSVTGLGAAALGGAATAGILMKQSQAEYDRTTDGVELERLADDGRTRAAAANVLLVTGAVALGAGIVLLLLE